MSASPQLFIEKFELRFDEPRVGIVILSNGEVVWGEQTANRYWRWIPTAVQITNAKAIGVSGHDEDYVYIADQLGLARFDWRTPELFRSRIENSPAQIDQMYGSLGTRMFFQSGEGVLEFDARSERFAARPLDASDVSAFSANADANGASVILISKNAQVYASTSFNQGACAVTVYDSRSGRPDDYISIGSSGTGSGGIERIVKLTSESDLNLKRNCIFQIAGTKPGVIETFDWSMTTRLSQLTSGARVKIKIFANNDYAPLLRVLYMNARASSARGKGPVVIAQGGLKNLQTGCQVQTELSTQNPQPQGRQTLVRTTITDTNPGCAGVLRNVSVLMCNAAGGVAISSSFVSLFKVATTCSVDVTPSDRAN